MGADFCFCLLPVCEMTPERIAEASALLVDDDDWGVSAEELAEYLDRYSKTDYRDSREVGTTYFDGIEYLVTGGLSWGDPPTDEYAEWSHLERQIGHLLMKWAREDTPNSARGVLGKLLGTLDPSKQTDETVQAMKEADEILERLTP